MLSRFLNHFGIFPLGLLMVLMFFQGSSCMLFAEVICSIALILLFFRLVLVSLSGSLINSYILVRQDCSSPISIPSAVCIFRSFLARVASTCITQLSPISLVLDFSIFPVAL